MGSFLIAGKKSKRYPGLLFSFYNIVYIRSPPNTASKVRLVLGKGS